MKTLIERIKKFQEFLGEKGFGGNLLALPAPKTMLLEDKSLSQSDDVAIFTASVTELEILEVSRDLFGSGHYNIAVAESFKALDYYIRKKTGATGSGTSLMQSTFSSKNPQLYWSDRMTESQKNEQEGYMFLFAGAMKGIRNPTTHEFNWVEDSFVALELIVFAQHLLRKAKQATVQSK